MTLSGMLGGPVEYVANGNDNLSQLNLQRNHHLAGVFNLSKKLAPFVCPEGDEALPEVPKRDSYAPAKDRREAGVQQLASDSQAVGVSAFFDEQIKFKRGSSI